MVAILLLAGYLALCSIAADGLQWIISHDEEIIGSVVDAETENLIVQTEDGSNKVTINELHVGAAANPMATPARYNQPPPRPA